MLNNKLLPRLALSYPTTNYKYMHNAYLNNKNMVNQLAIFLEGQNARNYNLDLLRYVKKKVTTEFMKFTCTCG